MKITFLLCLSVTLASIAYSLVAPFIPLQLRDKGWGVFVSGMVFAAPSLTWFVGSAIIGKVMGKVGRRNMIMYGILMLAVQNALYAMTEWFPPNNYWYVAAILIIRLLEGIAISSIFVPACSIITICVPE